MMEPKRPTVRIEDLVGWDEDRVRAELGHPDRDTSGDVWHDPSVVEGPSTVTREERSGLRPTMVFGPVPKTIPPGAEYRLWMYHDVPSGAEPERWYVYLMLRGANTSDAGGAAGLLGSLGKLLGRGPRKWIVVETHGEPMSVVY
jgi:hypothetical protein